MKRQSSEELTSDLVYRMRVSEETRDRLREMKRVRRMSMARIVEELVEREYERLR